MRLKLRSKLAELLREAYLPDRMDETVHVAAEVEVGKDGAFLEVDVPESSPEEEYRMKIEELQAEEQLESRMLQMLSDPHVSEATKREVRACLRLSAS